MHSIYSIVREAVKQITTGLTITLLITSLLTPTNFTQSAVNITGINNIALRAQIPQSLLCALTVCVCSCGSVCYGNLHTNHTYETRSTCCYTVYSCASTASFDKIINETWCKIPSDSGQTVHWKCVTIITSLHMLHITYFTHFETFCGHRMKSFNLHTILLSSNESKRGNHSEYYATHNTNCNSETNSGT